MRAQKTGVVGDCSYSWSYSCWMLHCNMHEFVLCLHLKLSIGTWSGSRQRWETDQLGDCHVWPSSSGVHVQNSTFAHAVWTQMFLPLCENNFTLVSKPSWCHWPSVSPTWVLTVGWKLAGTFFTCGQTQDTHTNCEKYHGHFHKANSKSLWIERLWLNKF